MSEKQKKLALPGDKIECDLCFGKYTRSNKSNHELSQRHIAVKKIHDNSMKQVDIEMKYNTLIVLLERLIVVMDKQNSKPMANPIEITTPENHINNNIL